MAHLPDYSEQRRHFRHDLGEGCTLTFDGASQACRVLNASLGGALVSTANLPPVGTTVVLDMAHMGSIEGMVVRQGGSETAIRFDPEEAKAVGINDMITFVLNQDLLDGAAP